MYVSILLVNINIYWDTLYYIYQYINRISTRYCRNYIYGSWYWIIIILGNPPWPTSIVEWPFGFWTLLKCNSENAGREKRQTTMCRHDASMRSRRGCHRMSMCFSKLETRHRCNMYLYTICIYGCRVVTIFISMDATSCIYLSIDRSICLSVCLSVYLSIDLSIDLSIYLLIDRSIYLSSDRYDLSIYLAICLSVYLYIYILRYRVADHILTFRCAMMCQETASPQ